MISRLTDYPLEYSDLKSTMAAHKCHHNVSRLFDEHKIQAGISLVGNCRNNSIAYITYIIEKYKF